MGNEMQVCARHCVGRLPHQGIYFTDLCFPNFSLFLLCLNNMLKNILEK